MAEMASVSAASVDAATNRLSAAASSGASEVEAEAELASVPTRANDAGAEESMPFDDDGPAWPGESDETAFLSAEKEQGNAPPKAGARTLRQAAAEAEAALGPLPTIDALVARLPDETRGALDDLFRVKFTAVRRVREDLLKTQR